MPCSETDRSVGPYPEHRHEPASCDIPKISIIVNNFNYASFVGRAIDSALSQDWPNFEVIVVDDGSTDFSIEIIRAYEYRIKAIFKTNGGQGSAFNAGFRQSTGDFICFLDADDYYLPGALTHMMRSIKADNVFLQYRMLLVNEHEEFISFMPQSGLKLDSGDVRRKLLQQASYNVNVTSGLCFARWALEKVMPIEEEPYRLAADGYLVNSLPFYGKIGFLDLPLSAYRRHMSNDSGGINLPNTQAILDLVRKKLRYSSNEIATIRKHAALNGLVCRPDLEFANVMGSLRPRLISLRLAPKSHPFPEDSRLTLARRGLFHALSMKMPLQSRIIMIPWWSLMAVVPGRYVPWLSRWIYDSNSLIFFRVLRSMQHHIRRGLRLITVLRPKSGMANDYRSQQTLSSEESWIKLHGQLERHTL